VIVESLAVVCPVAITCASVVVAERVRERRRRELLNRALHELRRPLQALVLQSRFGPGSRGDGGGQLDQALAALAGIDRQVNGSGEPAAPELVDARALAADAVRRWRGPAAVEGRSIELAWHANGSRLQCNRAAVAAALDNLIANAVEHGHGPIRVEGTQRPGRLRLVIADGVDAGSRSALPPVARATDHGWTSHRHQAGLRRGHGLRIVADVAADHGGRFAACAHADGASAVLELPLAEAGASAR
jgi:hypothetical protein